MRNILIALFVLGIGWAVWNDYSRVDPEWKESECYDGISYSLHQREDDRWVLCIRNSYMERMAVDFKVGGKSETGLVSTGQQACFIVEPGDDPKAEIEGLSLAGADGRIIERLYGCDDNKQ
jgi:hypothetical protein